MARFEGEVRNVFWRVHEIGFGVSRFYLQKSITFFISISIKNTIFLLANSLQKNLFYGVVFCQHFVSSKFSSFFPSKCENVFQKQRTPAFGKKNQFSVKSYTPHAYLVHPTPPVKSSLRCSLYQSRKRINLQAKSAKVYEPR